MTLIEKVIVEIYKGNINYIFGYKELEALGYNPKSVDDYLIFDNDNKSISEALVYRRVIDKVTYFSFSDIRYVMN